MYIEVVIFGSPGNGFCSFPKSALNDVSHFDYSQSKAYDLECLYIQNSFESKIVIIRRGLFHEANIGEIRSGSSLGLMIKTVGFGLKKNRHLEAFDVLKKAIETLHAKNSFALFDSNNRNLYRINSFEERNDILLELISKVRSKYLELFDNDFVKIDSEITYRIYPKEIKKEPQKLKEIDNTKIVVNETQEDNMALLHVQFDQFQVQLQRLKRNLILFSTIIGSLCLLLLALYWKLTIIQGTQERSIQNVASIVGYLQPPSSDENIKVINKGRVSKFFLKKGVMLSSLTNSNERIETEDSFLKAISQYLANSKSLVMFGLSPEDISLSIKKNNEQDLANLNELIKSINKENLPDENHNRRIAEILNDKEENILVYVNR